MDVCSLTSELSVSPQIIVADVAELKALGFGSIVCHRPDGEAPDQPNFEEIALAAQQAGLYAIYQPVAPGQASTGQADEFAALCADLPKPVLAYCRTGMRSTTLWALSQADRLSVTEIRERAAGSGYDLKAVAQRIANAGKAQVNVVEAEHTVVIVGGGAAGIGVASSLRARDSSLDVAIIDPADVHYYQPGWTLVGRRCV